VHLDTLLKESVNWKNYHIGMVLLHKEEEPNGTKEAQSPLGTKKHPTGEFVVVA